MLARPAVVALLLCAVPTAGGAQLFERPWLDWQTVETAHFSIHYPRSLESWARFVAERIEAVDSAVTMTVGYTPPRKVQIVVEDPYELSNGFAFPLLRQPTIVFWASPPDPREDIGTFRVWGEMLSSHEFAHIAHLTRPSRNPLQRAFWRAMPVDLGPIPLRAPRWVMEGYATYVEGRVTGSGRPHGAWRPAILRQWAIEGRLPTYAQLSAWGDFEGGSFAYLAGSAYLEWLAQREGDSSLVAVWRRLTARQVRSFDDAFAGVFGDSPRLLYGRFTAELTASAKDAERRLAAAGLTQGELVQHLAWGTGDPAISPDGSRVALVLRSADRPGRVVIWRTAADTDTGRARAREQVLKRDPQDVPARPVYPPPRRVIATLRARGGRAFDGPRWLLDGRHVLVWRYARRADGSYAPDVYLWDAGTGKVRRVTRGAGVRDPDPMPDGSQAVGTRCANGHCDLVLVDLRSGGVRTLARGDERTTFYRPRASADGRTVAASRQRDGRWRVVLLSVAGGDTTAAAVDPEDGADRFDAAWAGPAALVAASDRDGTANLEVLQLDPAHSRTVRVRRLTRVTGAAVAPELNRADGSVWFLSMHSQGFDVRRLPASDSVLHPDSVPLLDLRLAPAVPQPMMAAPFRIASTPVASARGYGLGARVTRWLPGGGAEAGGADVGIALSNIDVVGRLSALLQGAAGYGDAWRGASLDLAWRAMRPTIRASWFAIRAGAPVGGPYDPSVSADLRGGSLRADLAHDFDLSRISAGIGGSLGRIEPHGRPLLAPATQWDRRDLLFGQLGGSARQGGDDANLSESFQAHADIGWTGVDSARYSRSLIQGALALGGRSVIPVLLEGSYGRVSTGAAAFERFALGGPAPSVIEPSLLMHRVEMPALPAGIATGDRLLSYRVAGSLAGLTPFYWGASVRDGAGRFDRWHRVAGIELTIDQPPVFVIETPGARLRIGIARSFDAPYARRTSGYATVVLEP